MPAAARHLGMDSSTSPAKLKDAWCGWQARRARRPRQREERRLPSQSSRRRAGRPGALAGRRSRAPLTRSPAGSPTSCRRTWPPRARWPSRCRRTCGWGQDQGRSQGLATGAAAMRWRRRRAARAALRKRLRKGWGLGCLRGWGLVWGLRGSRAHQRRAVALAVPTRGRSPGSARPHPCKRRSLKAAFGIHALRRLDAAWQPRSQLATFRVATAPGTKAWTVSAVRTTWLSRSTSTPQNSSSVARESPMTVERRWPTCISLATLGDEKSTTARL